MSSRGSPSVHPPSHSRSRLGPARRLVLLAVALVAQELGIHTLQRLLEALLGLLDACRRRDGERRHGGKRSAYDPEERAPRRDGKGSSRSRNGKTLQPRKADARDDAAGPAGDASHAARRRDAIECVMAFPKTSRRIRGRSRRRRRRHHAVVGRSRLKCRSPRVFRDGVKTARFAGIYAARRAGTGATRTVAVVLVRLVVRRVVRGLGHLAW